MRVLPSPFAVRHPATAAVAAAVPVLACGVGAAMAVDPRLGVGLVLASVFLPVVVLNLPLAIVLWFPLVFMEGLPAFNFGAKAGGFVITIAWIAMARQWLLGEGRRREIPRSLLAAVAALLVWLSLSLIWATDRDAVLADLWHWYAVVLLMLVVATMLTSAGWLRAMLWAFVAGATLSIGEGILSGGLSTSATALDTASEGRLAGAQGDPNFLAAGIVPAMALGAALLVTSQRMFERWTLGGMVALLGLGLAASGSRGGVLAAATAIVAALVLLKGRRASVLALTLLIVGVAAAWFSITPLAWERISNFDNGGSGREELWTVAWRMAGDNPVVGVGLDNYPAVAMSYVREPGALTRLDLIVEDAHVVHSVYLQLLAETGAIGLGLFLFVAMAALRAAWLASNRYDARGDLTMAVLARAVMVATIGLLASSVFISNGVDKRLWVLLGLGPALLAASSVRRWERPSSGALSVGPGAGRRARR